MKFFNVKCSVCLILILAIFQASAAYSRHVIRKRNAGGYDTPPPTTPTPTPPSPTPTTPAPPTPPPSGDCTCPKEYVLPSVGFLLSKLNLPLGETVLGLLGDNNVVNGLNKLVAALIFNLTGCPVETAEGMDQDGLLGLLNLLTG